MLHCKRLANNDHRDLIGMKAISYLTLLVYLVKEYVALAGSTLQAQGNGLCGRQGFEVEHYVRREVWADGVQYFSYSVAKYDIFSLRAHAKCHPLSASL